MPYLFFSFNFWISLLLLLLLIFLWTVGETVEIGNFDPKIATFWIESGNGFIFYFFKFPFFCLDMWVLCELMGWCLNASCVSLNAYMCLFDLWIAVAKNFITWCCTGKLKGVLLESGSPEVLAPSFQHTSVLKTRLNQH